MDDIEIYVPISMGTIAILIFTPIVMGIGFVEAVRTWFINNLQSIITVSVIAAATIALISSIYLKRITVAIASLFCSSQALFFLIYYGVRLPAESNGLAVIGNMFLFIIYFVIAGLDIIAGCAIPILGIFGFEKSEKKSGASFVVFLCGIIGAIGWCINIFLLFFL